MKAQLTVTNAKGDRITIRGEDLKVIGIDGIPITVRPFPPNPVRSHTAACADPARE